MADKFIGAPYPIVKTARGFFQKTVGVDSIKADLLALLLTNPKERVMLPTYGTGLRKLLFEPNDPFVVEEARELIINAINTWEPRITVDQIEISGNIDESLLDAEDTKEDIEHILSIRIIFFDPENILDVQELKLEVPLIGGQQ